MSGYAPLLLLGYIVMSLRWLIVVYDNICLDCE